MACITIIIIGIGRFRFANQSGIVLIVRLLDVVLELFFVRLPVSRARGLKFRSYATRIKDWRHRAA